MRSLVTENLGLKLVAVLLAGALWVFVQTQHSSEVAYFVPLELRGLPPDLVIVSDVPSTVNIRVAGPRAQQTMLTPRKLALTIDLGAVQPGLSSFEISAEQLALPNGLTLTQISPERVQLEVESLTTKEVPVAVVFHGSVPPGFRLDEDASNWTPERVTVRVPESQAAGLVQVLTKPVSLEGLRHDLRERVFLDAADRRIRSVSPETIVLELVIEEVEVEKTFDDLALLVHGVRDGTEVAASPATVRATLRGPFTSINGLLGPEILPRIDVGGLEPGEHDVDIRLSGPVGVETVRLDPPRARVIVSAVVDPSEAPEAETAEAAP